MSVEPAIPQNLRCPRTWASRMPAGFEAPYPAWMARFDAEATAPIKTMLLAHPAPLHPIASGFDACWADPARETEPVGRFMEVVAPPMERLEVAYSPPDRPQAN